MAESITITDNRTGESVEVPIVDGGVDAAAWRKLLPNVWFYDEAFMTTAATRSAITEIDGDAGILRYRGYPIEQLAEHSTYLEVAYLLIHGELPTPGAVRRVGPRHHVPHVHPRERAQALPRGLPLRRPPHGHARLGRRRAVDLLPRRQGHRRPREPLQADRPAHRQDAHARRRLPPLQRRHAVRLPRQLARLHRQLPVDAVEGGRAPLRRQPGAGPGPRRAVHPARRPRAELRHHGHAHGRLGPRRPLQLRGRRRRRALRPPPRRRQRGRHRHAQPDRLDRRRSTSTCKRVKAGEVRLQGFGHRVYKNYDPRAKIIKQTADEVFAVTGRNPLLDIALKLEEVALADEYFIVAPALPQRRLLLGPDLPGHGLPDRDVHRAVRHPPHVGLAGPLGRAARAGPEDRPPPPALRGRRRAVVRADRPSAADRPPTADARGHHRRRRARVARAPRPRARRRRAAGPGAGRRRLPRRPDAARRPVPAAARAPRRPSCPASSWPARSWAWARAAAGSPSATGSWPWSPGPARPSWRSCPSWWPCRCPTAWRGTGPAASPRTTPPPTTPCSASAAWPWASGSASTAPPAGWAPPRSSWRSPPGAEVVATVRNEALRAGVAALGATVVAPDGFGDARALRRGARAGRAASTWPPTSTPSPPAAAIAVIGVGAGLSAEISLLDAHGQAGPHPRLDAAAPPARGQGGGGPARRAPRPAAAGPRRA